MDMLMGMFNINENTIFRNIIQGYPNEKQFGRPDRDTVSPQETLAKLKVLRTYADGSVAATQRAVPNLLAPLGSAAFAISDKIQSPDGPVTIPQKRLGSVADTTVQETLLAKIKALTASIKDDTSVMGEANTANNFKRALMLTQSVTSAGISVESKYNVALALKPLFKGLRDDYANDLKALTKEIDPDAIPKLQEAKLGAFKGFNSKEIKYIEKFQRLQVADEQLKIIESLIADGTKSS